MNNNVKIAKQILKLAKALIAADEKTTKDFLDGYNYKDANSDFETVDREVNGKSLKFSVKLTDKIALHVVVNFDSDDSFEGTVTTQWVIDQRTYKNGTFQPDCSPKDIKIGGTYEEAEKQVTEAVAKCTKGLRKNK